MYTFSVFVHASLAPKVNISCSDEQNIFENKLLKGFYPKIEILRKMGLLLDILKNIGGLLFAF